MGIDINMEQGCTDFWDLLTIRRNQDEKVFTNAVYSFSADIFNKCNEWHSKLLEFTTDRMEQSHIEQVKFKLEFDFIQNFDTHDWHLEMDEELYENVRHDAEYELVTAGIEEARQKLKRAQNIWFETVRPSLIRKI